MIAMIIASGGFPAGEEAIRDRRHSSHSGDRFAIDSLAMHFFLLLTYIYIYITFVFNLCNLYDPSKLYYNGNYALMSSYALLTLVYIIYTQLHGGTMTLFGS